jgi:hypothetical protein
MAVGVVATAAVVAINVTRGVEIRVLCLPDKGI